MCCLRRPSPMVGARSVGVRLRGEGAHRSTAEPLGSVRDRVVTPRLHIAHRLVPGPPKRFAQGMGVVFSTGALLSWGLGAHAVAYGLVAALVVAATLESVFAICLGCLVFNRLMRWGVIPASVCAECNDLSRQLARANS